MTYQDARVSSDVVTRIVQLHSWWAKVLFDLGATNSFVFASFVDPLNLPIGSLEFDMFVSILVRKSFLGT